MGRDACAAQECTSDAGQQLLRPQPVKKELGPLQIGARHQRVADRDLSDGVGHDPLAPRVEAPEILAIAVEEGLVPASGRGQRLIGGGRGIV